eukprot:SAG31_NODE_117_length_24022_cov_6.878067_21_plen_475_part_00
MIAQFFSVVIAIFRFGARFNTRVVCWRTHTYLLTSLFCQFVGASSWVDQCLHGSVGSLDPTSAGARLDIQFKQAVDIILRERPITEQWRHIDRAQLNFIYPVAIHPRLRTKKRHKLVRKRRDDGYRLPQKTPHPPKAKRKHRRAHKKVPKPEPQPQPESSQIGQSQEPSPRRLIRLDFDWTSIDLGDILVAQFRLREKILALLQEYKLEHGTSKCMPAEGAEMAYHLLRAGVPPVTARRIERSLLDGDLDTEDVEMLNSVLPPPVVNDFAAVAETLHAHEGELHILHKYYCMAGLAGSAGNTDIMGITQFRHFANECKIAQKSATKNSKLTIPGAVVDQIFIRAQQHRQESGKADLAALALMTDRDISALYQNNVDEKDSDQKQDTRLGDDLGTSDGLPLMHFGAALVRVACHIFSDTTSINTRLQMLLAEHVQRAPPFSGGPDILTVAIEHPQVRKVYQRYHVSEDNTISSNN